MKGEIYFILMIFFLYVEILVFLFILIVFIYLFLLNYFVFKWFIINFILLFLLYEICFFDEVYLDCEKKGLMYDYFFIENWFLMKV